jgi:hypothetical protein
MADNDGVARQNHSYGHSFWLQSLQRHIRERWQQWRRTTNKSEKG